jgi:hypothetical protein
LIQVFRDCWVDPFLVEAVRCEHRNTEDQKFVVLVETPTSVYVEPFETHEAALTFARGTTQQINAACGCPDQPDLAKLTEDLDNAVGHAIAHTYQLMQKTCSNDVVNGYSSGGADARQAIREYFERLQSGEGV